jgi:hypothetical protein
VDVDTGLLPKDRVYNPFAINYVFKSLSLNSDKWIKSGHSGMIVKKLASSHLNSFTDIELTEYSMNNSHSPNNLSLESLMYFAGYLTIDRFDTQSRIFHMKVPNKSITDHLLLELELMLPDTIKEKLINDYLIHCQRFVEVLLDHKLSNEEKQAILVDLLDTLIHLIPHQLLKSNKALESTYNVLFSSALRAGLKKHQTIINEKSVSGGDIDVILFDDKSHSSCIIEFKFNGDLGKAFHQAATYQRKYPNIEKRKQFFWVAINVVTRSKDNTADLPPSERPSVQVMVHNNLNKHN